MKKIIFILIFIVNTTMCFAQEQLTWETNINKAIERSNKEKKPMMLFFTGSDWCGWCIRLQNEVFKTPEFTEWAKKSVVLVDLDFPRRTPQSDELRAQNGQLQQTFGVQGYPTVWIVNGTNKDNKINFEQLGKTGYVAGGPSAWLAGANEILARNQKVYETTTEAKPEAKPATTKNKKKKAKA